MIYSHIREQVVQGVLRAAATAPKAATLPPSLDRVRAQFDAAFFSVNSALANTFAANQDNREMLRVASDVTFTSGSGALPDNVLEKYISDGTFVVSALTKYSFRRYPDWLRGGDTRLGLWTVTGETMQAKTPAPVAAFTGTAAVSFICSPEVPATEDDEFVAPEDFVSDFIDAMILFISGQSAEIAAQTS